MEAQLKKELGTSMLKSTGHSGGGCISQGQSFDTDHGRVFVKINHKSQAKRMFDGELASLEAIVMTDTVKVPKPVKVIELDTGGAVFVMEHVDMRGLSRHSKQLGERLADLHLHNQRRRDRQNKEQQTVGKGPDVPVIDQFGFQVPTCCGYLPQSVPTALSFSTPPPSMATLSTSWASPGCSEGSATPSTLGTTTRSPRPRGLRRGISCINCSTI
uniref:protein-ribulosamine 3-kinase n=2 Tax=Oncorhynchus TaxID=8016 RepID=A0A8C7H9T8_ONCKI